MDAMVEQMEDIAEMPAKRKLPAKPKKKASPGKPLTTQHKRLLPPKKRKR